MNGPLRWVGALAVALFGVLSTALPHAWANGAPEEFPPYTYDVSSAAPIPLRSNSTNDAVLALVSVERENAAPPPAEPRGTSATPPAAVVATNTADDLAGAASRASSTVGPGRGPVYGTNVHTAFADEVAALGRSDIFTEVSYLNGQVVTYGTPGSVRLDVVVGSRSAPTAIWDLKTGSAALSPARIAQIQSHLPPGFQNVPVLEVRP